MDMTTDFVPALKTGYGWPLTGIALWLVNLLTCQLIETPGLFLLAAQLLLILGGLGAMHARRLPEPYSEWGKLIRIIQTLLIVPTAYNSVLLLAHLLPYLA